MVDRTLKSKYYDYFSVQAIKVNLKTLSSDGMAALASCTEPGKKPPPAGGGGNPHQLGQAGTT